MKISSARISTLGAVAIIVLSASPWRSLGAAPAEARAVPPERKHALPSRGHGKPGGRRHSRFGHQRGGYLLFPTVAAPEPSGDDRADPYPQPEPPAPEEASASFEYHPPSRPNPPPQPQAVVITHAPAGGTIERTPGGDLMAVHTAGGAVVRYGPDGTRQMSAVRGASTLVARGNGRSGYAQRTLMIRQRRYVQRTYLERGSPRQRIYRCWTHAGATFLAYLPSRFYRPEFYAWIGTPWDQPVYYRWNWAGKPWWRNAQDYFRPYPYYTGAVFWLTNYLFASTLAEGYQIAVDNTTSATPPPAGDNFTALTPDVKQDLVESVRVLLNQEAAEQRDVAAGIDPADAEPWFGDGAPETFLVPYRTTVQAGTQALQVFEGEVLRLEGPSADSRYLDMAVLASRNRLCPRGKVVSIRLARLQEMRNQMRAALDRGLAALQARQGRTGLFPLPAQVPGSREAPYARFTPEPRLAERLAQVAMEADQAAQAMLAPSSPK